MPGRRWARNRNAGKNQACLHAGFSLVSFRCIKSGQLGCFVFLGVYELLAFALESMSCSHLKVETLTTMECPM